MRTKILLLALSFVFIYKASAQTCPPNLDFENGDFSNWECFIGRTSVSGGQNTISLNPTPPILNRHEIIRSTAGGPGTLDPYGGFPQLCPYGGNYSVKLGNDRTNAEAEGISYTFQVPTNIDTFTFTYFYAVVFEDPGHSSIEQPRFFVTAYDVATGDLINCASYNYIATATIPGFQTSPVNQRVLYKNWTPTSLQFAGLAGRTVRLEFKTADCTLGGHFGYAYIDVASACTNILASAPYCIETNSLILNAPFGFQSYTWYDQAFNIVGTGQTITFNPPPVTSGIFYVDLIPYPGFGCRDTLQAPVTALPVPDTPAAVTQYNYCQFQNVPPLSASVSPGHQLVWYTTPTGGVGTNNAPVPPTLVPGTYKYYVSQKALFGCEGFRREITVNVYPTPIPSFTINTSRQCQNGNSFVFSSTSSNLNNPSYTWSFGDGQTYTSTDTFAVHSYSSGGNFQVKLTAINGGYCSAERNLNVTVIPKPVAAFNYPSVICENQTIINLTDNSSVPGGVAGINRWWWNINGQIVQTQNPPSFTAGLPGALPVRFVVTTTEGCVSDTNNTTLNIRHRPQAAFTIGDLLCNNEIITFRDESAMPQGATGESVSKWYWTFDNSINATSQHPSLNFNTGMHIARLVAESNFGCQSIASDKPFEIHPKPQVQLSINDSCVFVPITYAATDVLNNISKWTWNFGNGFKEYPPTITKTYLREGGSPFTIVSYTDKGCKDTLIRPFTIYDNKSFAGRDTVAAVNQPVQLDARGEPNMQYSWSPPIGLNNTTIEKPVALWDKDQLYILNTVTEKGCKKETRIFIKRYNGPELYVPSAFTPNGDGLNDFLKVVPVGIKSFTYLSVYNRHGELVYRTNKQDEGWDGTLRGSKLPTQTLVYIVQAVDYTGKTIFKKGTVTLIR